MKRAEMKERKPAKYEDIEQLARLMREGYVKANWINNALIVEGHPADAQAKADEMKTLREQAMKIHEETGATRVKTFSYFSGPVEFELVNHVTTVKEMKLVEEKPEKKKRRGG
jgi:hypothetical protein